MNILKLTDKPSELEAVKDKVLEELQYLRSLDTAGDGELSLSSFTYTQKAELICYYTCAFLSSFNVFFFSVL